MNIKWYVYRATMFLASTAAVLVVVGDHAKRW